MHHQVRTSRVTAKIWRQSIGEKPAWIAEAFVIWTKASGSKTWEDLRETLPLWKKPCMAMWYALITVCCSAGSMQEWFCTQWCAYPPSLIFVTNLAQLWWLAMLMRSYYVIAAILNSISTESVYTNSFWSASELQCRVGTYMILIKNSLPHLSAAPGEALPILPNADARWLYHHSTGNANICPDKLAIG